MKHVSALHETAPGLFYINCKAAATIRSRLWGPSGRDTSNPTLKNLAVLPAAAMRCDPLWALSAMTGHSPCAQILPAERGGRAALCRRAFNPVYLSAAMAFTGRSDFRLGQLQHHLKSAFLTIFRG